MLFEVWFEIRKKFSEMHLVICFLLLLIHVSNTSSGCKCNKQACLSPANCSHGLVWDYCYCCLVCGKGEGELCGGKNYIQGECGGSTQECVVRDTRNYLNRYKNKSEELIGRCEPYACAFRSCPYGQRCTFKGGVPFCTCNISCSGMINEPVCGEANHKRYRNECELRNEECHAGKRIGISIVPCQGSDIARVICSSSKMTLHLNRRVFGRRWPRRLVLNSPSCKAVVNKTHVTASTFYNGCGTTARYTLTSIIYSNTLRTLPPRNALISRTKKVLIPFKCEFLLRRRSRNRIHFIPIKLQKSESVGLGRYTRVLKDGSYVEVDTSRNYSVVLMTQRYRRLNVKLVPFFCYATPLSKKYSQIRFPLIEKGCPVEKNVMITSFTNSKIVLQIPGIRFKEIRKPGSNIRCRVRLCFRHTSAVEINCQPNCEAKMLKSRERRNVLTSGKLFEFSKHNQRDIYKLKSRKEIHVQLPKEL